MLEHRVPLHPLATDGLGHAHAEPVVQTKRDGEAFCRGAFLNLMRVVTPTQPFCGRAEGEHMDRDGGHDVRLWRGLINALGPS